MERRNDLSLIIINARWSKGFAILEKSVLVTIEVRAHLDESRYAKMASSNMTFLTRVLADVFVRHEGHSAVLNR